MKLSTMLVAVRKISSHIPRSNFSETDIEKAAQLILAVEGLINPIILKRTSLESFEVVDGHFEYYAAAKAREINLAKGEMINAFILDEENTEVLQQQVEMLRPSKETSTPTVSTNTAAVEARVNNLETRIEARLRDFEQANKTLKTQLESKIKEIEGKLPQKIEPLVAFNQDNQLELTRKFQMRGIYGGKNAEKIAAAIIEARGKQPNQEFSSLAAIVKEVKMVVGKRKQTAISDKKMLEFIDKWCN